MLDTRFVWKGERGLRRFLHPQRFTRVNPRKNGSTLFCTSGIVLQWLKSDQNLHSISHIFLDEIHEQGKKRFLIETGQTLDLPDIPSDFLLIILRDLLQRRKDLRLILMSATLNASKFSQYFNNCPLLSISGFAHPVEQFFLEDVVHKLRFQAEFAGRSRRSKILHDRYQYEQYLDEVVAREYCRDTALSMRNIRDLEVNFELIRALVRHIKKNSDSSESILIFLPGWTAISKLNDELKADYPNDVIVPLHSLLPSMNQRLVFDRPPNGVRKIVISTVIAETSVTIDDIGHVIDCGLTKESDYDPETNVQVLEEKFVTQSNLKQRRGRAGRVKPGKSYHLISKFRYERLPKHPLPELLRSRLENVCLQAKLLNCGKFLPFVQKAVDPPGEDTIRAAVNLLRKIVSGG